MTQQITAPEQSSGLPKWATGRGDQPDSGSKPFLRMRYRGRDLVLLTTAEAFPIWTVTLVAVVFAADRHVDLQGQWLLSIPVWLTLITALYFRTPAVRAVTIGVLVVATIGECCFSLWWQFYIYRLHNLPLFIPPGHATLYLAALSAADWRIARRFPFSFCGVAAVIACVWAILGVTVLPQKDLVGALGNLWWLTFLWWGRLPTAVAGVFYGVAYIEIYGVAMGTWRWQPHAWGVDFLTLGQPPVGATMFYVVFELGGFLIGPWIYFGLRKLQRDRRARRGSARAGPATQQTA
jgi:hypothetical protein